MLKIRLKFDKHAWYIGMFCIRYGIPGERYYHVKICLIPCIALIFDWGEK